MSVLAAAAAALLVVVLVNPPGALLVARRLDRRSRAVSRRVGEVTAATLALCAAGLVGLLGWGPGAGAAVTSGGLLVVTVGSTARAALRRRARTRRAAEVAQACDLVGSLVGIGYIPDAALAVAAEDCRVLEPVAAARRVGADVVAALRIAGARPGGEGLVRLAQAWEVGARTGAPLGQTLSAVAEAVRRDREIERVVMSELAGPRASGQVLGVLPVVGLAAGFAMGGEPLTFFVSGVLGPVCLVAGTGLACAGVFWTDALVLRATPGVGSRRGRDRPT